MTNYLLFFIVVLQSVALFWLWRRLDMMASERRVEATTFDHMQRQISALQRNLQQLQQLQQTPPPAPVVAAPRAASRPQQPQALTEGATPYNQAIELFKRGFNAADVAEHCGISRSEAELILSLYRNSPTA